MECFSREYLLVLHSSTSFRELVTLGQLLKRGLKEYLPKACPERDVLGLSEIPLWSQELACPSFSGARGLPARAQGPCVSNATGSAAVIHSLLLPSDSYSIERG